MPRSWTEGDDQTLAALHGQGLGLNAIAKEMDRGNATVSRHATALGLSFDRSSTARATEAAVKDAKARQAKLKLDLLGDIEQARLRLGDIETMRDFQAFGQGLDAVVRAYANFVRTIPEDGGRDLAKSMLGRILLAIDASLVGTEPLNPIGEVQS